MLRIVSLWKHFAIINTLNEEFCVAVASSRDIQPGGNNKQRSSRGNMNKDGKASHTASAEIDGAAITIKFLITFLKVENLFQVSELRIINATVKCRLARNRSILQGIFNFPKKLCGKQNRGAFQSKWFSEFHWLYKEQNDSVFCFICVATKCKIKSASSQK